jgi:glycosyltransferase involved in cell wall biosynthesis
MIEVYIANPDSQHSIKWFNILKKIGINAIWINQAYSDRSTSYLPGFVRKPFLALFIYLRLIHLATIASAPIRIHVQYLGYNAFALAFLPFRFKLISTVWGSDILLNRSDTLKRLILNRILTLSSAVTVDSMHLIPVLRELNVSNSKIHFVPFGTDTSMFRMKSITRISLNFSESNPCRFLSLRQLYSIYAVDEIIQAFAVFISEYRRSEGILPFVSLDIYATGDQDNELAQLVSSLDLNHFIRFKGSYVYSQLPNILSSYHFSISASHSDAGLSASIAESMACGVVPIVNDFGDNSYWVDHEMGLSFKTASVASLAKCLSVAYTLTYEQYILFSKNSRSQVVERLSTQSQSMMLNRLL